jgi:hypothetical protein
MQEKEARRLRGEVEAIEPLKPLLTKPLLTKPLLTKPQEEEVRRLRGEVEAIEPLKAQFRDMTQQLRSCQVNPKFTSFTGTKVQLLTLTCLPGDSREGQAKICARNRLLRGSV